MTASFALTAGAAVAEPVRIAALGDSLTQGYGLIQQEGFTAQLQDWLNEKALDVTIVNAGVSGDTTAGGLSRVDWTLTPDIDAMIVALGGNDVLRGIAPETARENLRGIMVAASEKDVPVLLVGINAPSNYGTDYKADFEAIYPDLADEFGALYFESFLGPLLKNADMDATLQTYMQPDGIHPNGRGVALIVAELGPYVADLAARAED
ncbi:arylesterase [Celeribacter litoreus]|uniref:arylesterase n=1 Tax=Celeribacter litoreus TaxID=2876714 RepID=UPI001CCF5D54|nr:arylesterase [Celeribacter litoreus]